MTIVICPFKATSPDVFHRPCTKESCPLWFENLKQCSFKASALFLGDIHQVVVRLGLQQKLINLPKEEDSSNENP